MISKQQSRNLLLASQLCLLLMVHSTVQHVITFSVQLYLFVDKKMSDGFKKAVI